MALTPYFLVSPYTNWSNSLPRHSYFEKLNDIVRNIEMPCFAKNLFDTQDLSTPHLGTVLIDAVDSDDRLRWSEVCWAAFLMANRWREKEYRGHEIVPVSIYQCTNCYLDLLTQPCKVFVYSIAGRNARVIQAHYEKGKFIVRKTEHVSFEEKNIKDFKLFLRWIMNIPKGKTSPGPAAARCS
jgi:hypothetical protein